jgi:Mn-dependent DtxR family transcriptional regulator
LVRLRNPDGVRLAELEKAHARPSTGYTPSIEDYLEVILELVEQKGYARSVDISEYLHVRPSSTTKMMQQLHRRGFLVYERYRGITLTEKGRTLAESVRERHELIAGFLRLLGVDDDTAHADTEGIEHHLHRKTVGQIMKFVQFATANPKWLRHFKDFDQGQKLNKEI